MSEPVDYLELDDPIFPDRAWYHMGETGVKATKALMVWAKGGRFHPYGTLRHEQDDYEFGESKEDPPMIKFMGELQVWSGHMSWSVMYRRSGESDSFGASSGYGTSEDAAYAACTMIEEHEREQYLKNLVIGVA